jgi:hypothetical protein
MAMMVHRAEQHARLEVLKTPAILERLQVVPPAPPPAGAIRVHFHEADLFNVHFLTSLKGVSPGCTRRMCPLLNRVIRKATTSADPAQGSLRMLEGVNLC